jgi:allophanate hydrolase subunit 2
MERPPCRGPPRACERWGAPEAWAALTTGEWAVSADSDRVGPRLTGPRLETAPATTVTGGYPVLAVVVTADLGVAAQLRPGDQVRFRTAL